MNDSKSAGTFIFLTVFRDEVVVAPATAHKNASPMLERLSSGCNICRAGDPRKTKNHMDHISEKGYASDFPYLMVHKPIGPMLPKAAMRISDVKATVDKERGMLRNLASRTSHPSQK